MEDDKGICLSLTMKIDKGVEELSFMTENAAV